MYPRRGKREVKVQRIGETQAVEVSPPCIWTGKLQECPYVVKVPGIINNGPTTLDKYLSSLPPPPLPSLLRTEEIREGSPKNHEFPPSRGQDNASNRKGAKAAESGWRWGREGS